MNYKFKSVSMLVSQALLLVGVIIGGMAIYTFYTDIAKDISQEVQQEYKEMCGYLNKEKALIKLEKIIIEIKNLTEQEEFINGSKQEYLIFENASSSPQITYLRIPKEIQLVDAYVEIGGFRY